MKLKIEIDLNGHAFEDPAELTRILTELTERISQTTQSMIDFKLRDINGNSCGSAETFLDIEL